MKSRASASWCLVALGLGLLITEGISAQPGPQGGQLRFDLRADPKTFNPLLVEDDASEAVRYLTAGVLIRLNRESQKVEPALATSWVISDGGRRINLKLRTGVTFSDGTPFSAADVVYTFNSLMDSDTHSATADSFRSAEGPVAAKALGESEVEITFPAPLAGMEVLFDQVGILSARSAKKEMAVLGPFVVADYKPGSFISLARNPHYWKKDSQGRPLPYLQSIQLNIEQNRDVELLKFRRGDLDLINSLDSTYFQQLMEQVPGAAHDAGQSLDSEELWFNQVAGSPMPAYKKKWFRSQTFRTAISGAINREDLCRIVYGGHAHPGFGPVSPVNQYWFNAGLKAPKYDRDAALKLLEKDGFYTAQDQLHDHDGNVVEFSVITNAGNKSRERMAAMIQQDLAQIGIRLNVVTLDFPSLIERITRTFDYEACILGQVNDTLDPNAQMHIWLSSASNHQWNPEQKTPETAWEAEIDHLMRDQASTADGATRKRDYDRVQQIVSEQAPFIYLVYKDALSAVSPALRNATPLALHPQTYWNVDTLYFDKAARGSDK